MGIKEMNGQVSNTAEQKVTKNTYNIEGKYFITYDT